MHENKHTKSHKYAPITTPLPRPMPSQSLALVKPSSTSNGPCHTLTLIDPCQADSWSLSAGAPHHPDGCFVAAPPKKKTRRIKFFLHQCSAEKTKKSTEDGFFCTGKQRRALGEGEQISSSFLFFFFCRDK